MNKYLIELIGTFLLMFLGCGSIFVLGNSELVGCALVFGIVLFALYFLFSKISGAHFNPAVSIAMCIDKRITTKDCALYIVFQIIGSLIAFILLFVLSLQSTSIADNYSCLRYGYGTNSFAGSSIACVLIVETILTFIFVFVFLLSTKSKNLKAYACFIIPSVFVVLFMFAYPISGGVFNPARAIGFTFVFDIFHIGPEAILQLLIVLVANVVGSLLAYWIYSIFSKSKNVDLGK